MHFSCERHLVEREMFERKTIIIFIVAGIATILGFIDVASGSGYYLTS